MCRNVVLYLGDDTPKFSGGHESVFRDGDNLDSVTVILLDSILKLALCLLKTCCKLFPHFDWCCVLVLKELCFFLQLFDDCCAIFGEVLVVSVLGLEKCNLILQHLFFRGDLVVMFYYCVVECRFLFKMFVFLSCVAMALFSTACSIYKSYSFRRSCRIS